jgi:hypothetical protein
MDRGERSRDLNLRENQEVTAVELLITIGMAAASLCLVGYASPYNDEGHSV